MEALIGLIGVIVGSAITVTKDSWTTWRERRREGSYSAIRLICILEEYADKCIDVVGDDGTVYGRPAGRTKDGEEYYQAQVASPDPVEFPADIGWRSLKGPLMHRTLALPNMARSTDRHIQAASDFASPPDYSELFEARQEGYARLGLEALEIADALRKQFQITAKGRATLNTDWNPKAFLSAEIAKLEQRRIEWENMAEVRTAGLAQGTASQQ